MACMSRVFAGLSAFLWVEKHVLGTAPAELRTFAFYGAVAFVGQSIVRSVVSVVVTGPTPDTKVTIEAGTLLAGAVPWVAAGMRGWRESMEDAHVASLLDASVFAEAALFAVLDGHGGKEVSALASQLLVRQIETCGRDQLRLNGKASKGHGKTASADLQQSMESALPRLDLRLRRGCLGLGGLLPGMLHPFSTVGSTACLVAVDFVRREVLCASIGDSRAMLIRNGKAIALSEDHKPENPGERARIQNAGGQVIKVGPCHRVDGNLNLSRALGDFYLKNNAKLPPEKQKVCAVADSMRSAFQGGAGELLVVACDGLFERRSNQDIANLVWPRYKSGMAMEQIAKEVLQACCARGVGGRPVEEGTDNETIILVKLPAGPAAEGSPDSRTDSVAADASNGSNGAAADAASDALRPGQQVQIHGLESEAARILNGLAGIIEADSKNGRYAVRLAGSGETKAVKGENLKVV